MCIVSIDTTKILFFVGFYVATTVTAPDDPESLRPVLPREES